MKNSIVFTLISTLFLSGLLRAEAPLDPKIIEQQIKEAKELSEAASQKLTGGLLQINQDKRIETLISDSQKFKACKDAFSAKLKATPNSAPDVSGITECKDVLGSDQASLEDLTQKLNLSFFTPDGLSVDKNKNYTLVKKYMEERLSSALYGEKKDKVQQVDHKTFYALYKTQINKSFLLDLSSYCSETYTKAKVNSGKDYDATKEKSYQDSTYSSQVDFAQMGKDYSECLFSLGCQCYGGKACTDMNKKYPTLNISQSSDTDIKNKSCVLVTRLKQMKQQIMYLDNVEAEYAKLQPSNALLGNEVTNYKGTEDGKTVDDMTNFSSGDYRKAVGEKGDLEGQIADLAKKNDCQLQVGQAFDENKCGHLGKINKDEYEKILLEHQLKSKLMADTLTNVKSKDDLQKFLEDQKMAQAEIDKILVNADKDFATTRKELEDKLKTERQAVIDEINQQMTKDVVIVDKDGKVDSSTKIADVNKRTESQLDRTERLIHYTNVVSAYLNLKDVSGGGAGKSVVYTKALSREIAEASKGVQEYESKNYFKHLGKDTKAQQDKGNTEELRSIFNLSTLNEILGE